MGRRVASSRALKVICFIFDQAGLIDWEDEPGGRLGKQPIISANNLDVPVGRPDGTLVRIITSDEIKACRCY